MPSYVTLILLLGVMVGMALCAGCTTQPPGGGTPTPVPATTVVTLSPTANGTGMINEPRIPLSLTAENNRFDTANLTAPAGSAVALGFVNNDRGVSHNFALYTDASATTPIFQGGLIRGPAITTYMLTAPSMPGTYFFRCDVHPGTMSGTFIVT